MISISTKAKASLFPKNSNRAKAYPAIAQENRVANVPKTAIAAVKANDRPKSSISAARAKFWAVSSRGIHTTEGSFSDSGDWIEAISRYNSGKRNK